MAMRLYTEGFGSKIFGLDVDGEDIHDRADFQTFAKRVLKFVTDNKRVTMREIKCGLPERTVRLVPDRRDYDYWITLALRWYAESVRRTTAGAVTYYYAPCKHGNDPALCMELECIGRWKRRVEREASRSESDDKPYLHPPTGKKTTKIGGIRI